MKPVYLLLITFLFQSKSDAQLYYPPITGTVWETLAPESLGWCEDSIEVLYDYLEATNSKAFIVLKDGKIVLEKYFGTFTQASPHVWNSAGKTLTAIAVGIAQEEGFLSIEDTTSDYLGQGWTSLTPAQEEKITIRHQLTMTTGLDDGTADFFCTDPACLTYLAEPGTRWAYHNGPYTLLDSVIEVATGMTLNDWTTTRIESITGMTGQFYPIDYNNIFISNARSMARFGLLLQSGGVWNGTPVLDDPGYFNEMTHSSQTINRSYGYLTWLNGQSSYMIPQSQLVIPGSAMPNAPADVYAALGKNSQLINVAPTDGLVLIRMGESDGNSLVSTQYNDTIWQYVNRLSCTLETTETELSTIGISPNPSHSQVTLTGWLAEDSVTVYDPSGKTVALPFTNGIAATSHLSPGMYLLSVERSGNRKVLRLIIN